jgi:hypothetical protein
MPLCLSTSRSDVRCELSEEEKEAMGYNVVMLEYTLCKIKRLVSREVTKTEILSEIL